MGVWDPDAANEAADVVLMDTTNSAMLSKGLLKIARHTLVCKAKISVCYWRQGGHLILAAFGLALCGWLSLETRALWCSQFLIPPELLNLKSIK